MRTISLASVVLILKNIALYLSLIGMLAICAIVYLAHKDVLPPELPLLYIKRWGEPQLVADRMLFILPIIATLCTITNDLLIRFVYAKYIVQRQVLMWATYSIQLAMLALFIKVILKMT